MPSGIGPQIFFIAGPLIVVVLAFAIRAGVGRDEAPVGIGEALEVTEEEVALTLESLTADSTFIALTAGNEWSIAERLPNIDGQTSRKVGVALIIDLTPPVASSGPWKSLYCQGTVVQEYEFAYSGISTVLAVSTLSGELLALSPFPPGEASSNSPHAELPERPGCPIGFEDEEN